MTREMNIETIRAACIKVNPEGPHWIATGAETLITHFDDEPYTLADVLLAIQDKQANEHAVDDAGFFLGRNSNGNYVSYTLSDPRWNLYKDDLTKQSDECISFLADLLA